MTLFEVVPPAAAKPEALESSLHELQQLRGRVDAINIPEIHDEDRPGERTSKFIERVEPRILGSRIKRELGIDVVINRVTVHDAGAGALVPRNLRAVGHPQLGSRGRRVERDSVIPAPTPAKRPGW